MVGHLWLPNVIFNPDFLILKFFYNIYLLPMPIMSLDSSFMKENSIPITFESSLILSNFVLPSHFFDFENGNSYFTIKAHLNVMISKVIINQ